VSRGVLTTLRDLPLLTVALAIALGLSLWVVADGISDLIATLLIEDPETDKYVHPTQPLTWEFGERILTFGHLLRGLIQLAVVLLVALVVARRRRPAQPR
jgi:ABC-type uncharacterized transport system permease subunit